MDSGVFEFAGFWKVATTAGKARPLPVETTGEKTSGLCTQDSWHRKWLTLRYPVLRRNSVWRIPDRDTDSCRLRPGVVRAYPLLPKGAGYRAQSNVLISSSDSWFRPVDVCTHPDGSILIADWYDAGVGGHRYSDNNTGRIYRLKPSNKPLIMPDYDHESVSGMLTALASPNIATRFEANSIPFKTESGNPEGTNSADVGDGPGTFVATSGPCRMAPACEVSSSHGPVTTTSRTSHTFASLVQSGASSGADAGPFCIRPGKQSPGNP